MNNVFYGVLEEICVEVHLGFETYNERNKVYLLNKVLSNQQEHDLKDLWSKEIILYSWHALFEVNSLHWWYKWMLLLQETMKILA